MERVSSMFTYISVLSVVGAALAALFGGWDGNMTTLCIFMLADYITGIILAGVFHNSPKSEGGRLESKAGLKGLCRKGAMLLIVMIAARLDDTASLNSVLRDGTVYALVVNECISILENLGLMGVPLPRILTQAIEQLRSDKGEKTVDRKAESDSEDHEE